MNTSLSPDVTQSLAVRRHHRSLLVGAALLLSGTILLLTIGSPSPAFAQTAPQVRLIQSDPDRLVLDLELSGYDSRDVTNAGARFTALAIPGFGHTSESGKPQMPIKGVMLGIPAGAQPSLKIIADQVRTDSLKNPPLPAPSRNIEPDLRQPLPPAPLESYSADRAAYSSSAPYPATAARLASASQWRSQRIIVVQFSPLQYNAASRQLVFHKRLRVQVDLAYGGGSRPRLSGTPVNEGPAEALMQSAILNYSSAKSWRDRAAPALSGPKGAAYSGDSWYKVGVKADGLYRVTCSELAGAGLDVGNLDPATLKVFKQGQELAIQVLGGSWADCSTGDYFQFFGQSFSGKYSDTNVYWVTHGGVSGKRMATRSGAGTGTTPANFTDTIHREEQLEYVSTVPKQERTDRWLWNHVSEAHGAASSPFRDYDLEIGRLGSGGSNATLRVSMIGLNRGNHHTQVSINGYLVDDTVWSGQVERLATLSFPHAYLQAGANTVRIAEPNDLVPPPNPLDVIYVDYLELDYTSSFRALSDTIKFRQDSSGGWKYRVSGYTSSSIQVFDTTDPYATVQITGATVNPDGPTYTLEFAQSNTAPAKYAAQATAEYLTPTSVVKDTASNLRSGANGADYVIISHSDFADSMSSLATFRASQGLRVKQVDVEDVYDEFSDGVVDAQSIRDFLAFAYSNWQPPAPTYVLLVGDGTFDPKGYCVTPLRCGFTTVKDTYLPPYLRFVDPTIGETASDSRLVAFSDTTGNVMPFMAIGRLPANRPEEASAMASKILSNEQAPPPGDWRTRVTFVADNDFEADGTPDQVGNFWYYSDSIASVPYYMPPPFVPTRIYYNPCDPAIRPECAYTPKNTLAEVKNAITTTMNAGAIMVSYVGHGAIHFWSHNTLTNGTIGTLENGDKTPFFLEMTCYTGFFQHPSAGNDALGEVNVRADGRGALATLAASGLGTTEGHDLLERGFFDAVMRQGYREIGLGVLAAKAYLLLNSGSEFTDIVDTFLILGDPASRLAMPSASITNLSSFQGDWRGERVALTWATSSETANAGFNLLRSTSLNGHYSQVNPVLIPSQCGDCPDGALYSFNDTSIGSSPVYYYKLQTVSTSGEIQVSGLVPVGAPLYLPLIKR